MRIIISNSRKVCQNVLLYLSRILIVFSALVEQTETILSLMQSIRIHSNCVATYVLALSADKRSVGTAYKRSKSLIFCQAEMLGCFSRPWQDTAQRWHSRDYTQLSPMKVSWCDPPPPSGLVASTTCRRRFLGELVAPPDELVPSLVDWCYPGPPRCRCGGGLVPPHH